METFYTIIFFLVAAILSAFMRKKQKGREEDSWPDASQPPRSPVGEPSPKSIGWEAELRELLEGKIPASERPSSPPPIVVPAESRAVPAPPPLPIPAPAQQKSLHEWSKTPQKSPAQKRVLAAADAKYTKAQNIQDRVAERMKEAANLVNMYNEPARQYHRSKEMVDALHLFRTPRSARMAVIISEVFGQPKALQDK